MSAIDDPIALFLEWQEAARRAIAPEPDAAILASVSPSGMPSARVILVRHVDATGFVFYTNLESAKARDLASGQHGAALCFYWQPLERQVRIEGTVEKVSREESEAYFRTRPLGSQIGAWVSQQSETLESREELDRREQELLKKFASGEVPLPPSWGGYRVVPDRLEFWQGRPSRLHDRIEYLRTASGWQIRRLSP